MTYGIVILFYHTPLRILQDRTVFISYLTPFLWIPHGRAIKTITGLHRDGLGLSTLLILDPLGVVAVCTYFQSAGDSSNLETNTTCCRTGAPSLQLPPGQTYRTDQRTANICMFFILI